MVQTTKGFVRRLAALLLAGLAVTVAAAASPPAEHFTRKPAIDAAVLASSGKRLAMLVLSPTGRRQIAVIERGEQVGQRGVVGGKAVVRRIQRSRRGAGLGVHGRN